MAVSPQLIKVIEMCRSLVAELDREGKTIEQMRVDFHKVLAAFPMATDVACVPVDAGGVPAQWIVPPKVDAQRVLLYLHGGGYVVCSVSTHRDLIARLARAAGMRALGVDYRRAPEHPFPAAVEDAMAAYRWLIAAGIKPQRMAIAGDSAGGGLTLATLVALRDGGDPLPATAICISPWVDLESNSNSMKTKADVDPLVKPETLQAMARLYLGKNDPRTPLAAPLHADLRNLPPLLLLVGSSERLLDDALRIEEHCKAAGGDVRLEVWQDMIHCWPLFASILAEGQQAIDRMGAFLREHLIG